MKKVWIFLAILIGLNLSADPGDRNQRWQQFQQKEGSDWSAHWTTGDHIRSLYGRSARTSTSGRNAAGEFLEEHKLLFGVDDSVDLRLTVVEESTLGTHHLYQQYYGGLPVYEGELSIHLDRSNRVIAAASHVHADLHGSLSFHPDPSSAYQTVYRMSGEHGSISPGKLMVLPMGRRPAAVWLFEIESDKPFIAGDPALSYVALVDAANPNIVLRFRKTSASFNGTGNVFLENPVVTAELTSEKFLYLDASTALSGKFAVIYNANYRKTWLEDSFSGYTTAREPDRQYDYDRADPRFTEAMAYFHINRAHDLWKSFGFKKLDRKARVVVNVAREDGGPGFDNAFYTRTPQYPAGVYVFGAGNKFGNFGLDADVYYHEYGHGVLDHQKPGLLTSIESNYPGSFHEGFSDIASAAATGNAKLAEFALSSKKTNKFKGRDLENNNRFPDDVILPAYGRSEVHHTGLIVGGSWWDLQKKIGLRAAQELLFRSLKIIPNEMNFFDLRDAFLTADRILNNGANQQAIEDSFSEHGLGGIDPGQTGAFQVNQLKTAKLDFGTYRIKLQSTFHAGDVILVFAGYTGSNLTPGYNIFPIEFELTGPGGTMPFAYLTADEILNGTHKRKKGALQAYIFADNDPAKGSYTVTLRSRLGGSQVESTSKSVTFSIN